jgi:hypothetical protein
MRGSLPNPTASGWTHNIEKDRVTAGAPGNVFPRETP